MRELQNAMDTSTHQTTARGVYDALTTAGYADMITDRDYGRVLLSVIDSESDEALAAIRRRLPADATADYTGNSNTIDDGDTEEEIRVEWSR